MFAVFGVSVEKARSMALKKTKRTVGKGQTLRTLTDAEYQQALAEATEKFMRQMKPVILSPEYSTPAIAEQFKAMALQGGVKRAEVRIKAPIQSKDKKGRPRTSKSWMLYEPGRDYELKGAM
ncbi:hypothetical protein ABC502_07745 [Alkalimonas sp. NCh-2]|uniref:hypothetical protein n=1 Tax=Alkalimonas sp. NCh-2 TaxID=3144846 RepID=UPI0031F6B362